MARIQSCDELWDLLSAYADNAATPNEASRIEGHVAICTDCARDFRFMRETAHVLAELPEIIPPSGLRESIFAATIYKPIRPSLQQRLREAGRRLVPSLPLRALAFAGSAAAILLVAYVSTTRAPQITGARDESGARAGNHSFLGTTDGANLLAKNDLPKVVKPQPNPNRAADDPAMDDPDDFNLLEPAPSTRAIVATRQTRLDQSVRLRAESALQARTDMTHRFLSPRTSPRIALAAAEPGSATLPLLQPERSAQPNDMLSQPSINTADMKTPMMPMDMAVAAAAAARDMSHADMAAGGAAATVEKSHVTLVVNTSESISPNSMVTLADLRRQLRRHNSDSSAALHPELRLRNHRDTLDVVKSTF